MMGTKTLKIIGIFIALATTIIVVTWGITSLVQAQTPIQNDTDTIKVIELNYSDSLYTQLTNDGVKFKIGGTYVRSGSLRELGITISSRPNTFAKLVFRNNKIIISIDKNIYQSYTEKLSNEYSYYDSSTIISLENDELPTGMSFEDKIVQEDEDLSLLEEALSSGVLEVNLKYIDTEAASEDIFLFFLKQKRDKLGSLQIILEVQDEDPIQISGAEILPALSFDVETEKVLVDRKALRNIIGTILDGVKLESKIKLSKYGYKDVTVIDSKPDIESLLNEVTQIVSKDKIKEKSFVTLGYIVLPGTTGEYKDRYIEVDLSQQMSYVWENGKLIHTYRVSSGDNNLTPIGIFHIQNKSELAFSKIYSKWMPYWMAFSYLPEYGGSVGFHALTYWKDENGNTIYEAENRIGQAVSGGCVRLTNVEARILYNWAEVGDAVMIHE